MKTFILIALVAVAIGKPLLSREFVAEINSVQSQWVATEDNIFKNMSRDEIMSHLGARLAPLQGLEGVREVTYGDLVDAVPESFDSRDEFKNCVHEIKDQARCGSCWAFGASEAFSDRVCIASKGTVDVVLSPQYLVSCDGGNFGCQGGYLNVAWNFLASHGVPSEACVSYTSGSGDSGTCPSKCDDGSDIKLYKATNVRTYKTVADQQLDILTNGPVETGFSVYQDFMTYKSGVYKHTTGGLLGGHAIKVVGWGVEKGVKYWIAANSWGPAWGEDGFFRIQFGECRFDTQFISGDPVLE